MFLVFKGLDFGSSLYFHVPRFLSRLIFEYLTGVKENILFFSLFTGDTERGATESISLQEQFSVTAKKGFLDTITN